MKFEHEALALRFAPELYYERTNNHYKDIYPQDFGGLYWRAVESSVSWADVCIQYIAYFTEQRWAPSILDKLSDRLPGWHPNDYVPVFIYFRNRKPVRVIFDIFNYDVVGEINAPSRFIPLESGPRFCIKNFYRGLLPLEDTRGYECLGGIPIQLSPERLDLWWRGFVKEGSYDERARLIIRKKLEDPFKKIMTFRDRRSRLGSLFNMIFQSVREQQTRGLSMEESIVQPDVENLLRIEHHLFTKDIEEIYRIADEILGKSSAPKYISIRGGKSISSPEFDNLEHRAYQMIGSQDYFEARRILEEAIELFPEHKQTLQNELGFLYNFEATSESDEKKWNNNRELIEWRKNVWYVLSDKVEILPGRMEESQENEEIETPDSPKVEYSEISDTPQGKGEMLEEAVLKLFRNFFIIAKGQEKIVLEKLRKQRGGTQFGFDISFECTVKENEKLKCHIECKDLKEPIKLKDISDKIMETEDNSPDIDHWILISPHSSPSNILDGYVRSWNSKKKYPFEVQIWSPDNGVEEFFGLCPEIYDQFYRLREGETHPCQWSEEKRNEVFKKWKQKIKPVVRLPNEWEGYIKDPSSLFIKGDRKTVLENLYDHYVEMRCMDERGCILSQSLEQQVHEWLNDTETSAMVLLGEFGSGKSAFTYILSRNLVEEFKINPSNGWIPVRFALRDYNSAGDSQEFLKKRLERFGGDLVSWDKLKKQFNLLVILDGFDEMTRELDQDTIRKNIDNLEECCDEFEDLKILITSRTHFFENQKDKKRLLERLPPNRVYYLAPIDRGTTIEYLEKYAKTLHAEEKLKNIRKLHDPIGLAQKPLFLHMVKETLLRMVEEDKLPEKDINEKTLYETYINDVLKQKKWQLDDYSRMSREETRSNLIEILEQVALELQESENDFVLLEKYSRGGEKDLAELLWDMSEPDEIVVEDATARVGIRSLLTRVETGDDAHKWPVDFCHRSMREYFVAKGMCRALSHDIERAGTLLTELSLNHEILYFTAELMKGDDSRKYEKNLESLIESTRGTNQRGNLGGNAVTLLYRLKDELHGDEWYELNLDGAILSGADLSRKNFSGTSLRYANLDNVNFEGADFRNCDLTGVRIEETAPVLAVTINRCFGDRIIAAYGDNTIREWNFTQRSKKESRIICENTNGSVNWLGINHGFNLCAMTNEEVFFYDFENQGELLQKSCFRRKSKYRYAIAKEDILLLVSDGGDQMSEVLLIDLQQGKIAHSLGLEKVTLCENFNQQAFVLSEGNTLEIREIAASQREKGITLKVQDVTSLYVSHYDRNSKYLLACGQRNGEVLVWQVNLLEDRWQEKLLFRSRVHDGLVSSLAFLDDSRIISGGIDRRICISRFGSDLDDTRGVQEQDLCLTVRCKGLKIEGVKSNKEYEILRNLISKAEKT